MTGKKTTPVLNLPHKTTEANFIQQMSWLIDYIWLGRELYTFHFWPDCFLNEIQYSAGFDKNLLLYWT